MTKSRTTVPAPVLKAPFPYFGGKSRTTQLVWPRLGNDLHWYIEPFFGSGAMLLGCPAPAKNELVNDADAFIANFWRAIRFAPREVATHADWPINESDIEARHRWLCQRERKAEFSKRVRHEPRYFDAQTAGWWAWGLSSWIAGGWCVGEYVSPDSPENRGSGINSVNGRRPDLSTWMGVNAKSASLSEWFLRLQSRLRRVRVLCHDWKRAVQPIVIGSGKPTAVFLDPPYSKEAGRASGLYRVENLSVAHEVREWAIAHGKHPHMRIALCGYEGEHPMPGSWTEVSWRALGGYCQMRAPDGTSRGTANRDRERIWFSPHCLEVGDLPGGEIVHKGTARRPARQASAHRRSAAVASRSTKARKPRRGKGRQS